MMSLAKAAKDYYLQKLGEISPREDYYLRGGTATGTWRGTGANEAGLTGTVTAEGLVRLFDGEHPATGEQLGRHLRRDGVAAWDVTFSADKSVSLLWALGDPEVRRQVLEAFEAATTSAVGYLESVASSTRGARRRPVLDDNGQPVIGDDGKPQFRTDTWPIPTHGYVAASFTEFTSREDDPQLHTHVVVANRVEGIDGKWRAVDGQLLYRHQKATSAIHEAELRRELTQRLGVEWQPVRNGVADIEGFTRSQIEEFSRRRQQIEAWIESEQLTPSAAAYEAATLATRRAKADHPVDSLMPDWRQRAASVGLTGQRIAQIVGRSHDIRVPSVDDLYADLASSEGLTKSRSTFGRADVIERAAGALPEGGSRQQIEQLAHEFLAVPEVVPILPALGGERRLPDVLGLDDDHRQFLEQHLAPYGGTPKTRRADGTLHPGLAHELRYTTAELLAKEQQVVATAIAGIDTGRFTVLEALVDEAIKLRPHLTDGQTEMLRRLTTTGNAIEVIVGVGGAGKTAVMDAVRELADASHTPIVGAALSGRAAAELQSGSGIASYTITRLLGETERSGGLRNGTVVVIDEAGMVGTRHLDRLARLTQDAHGKLILTGDDHQLAEIDAGGLFTALASRLPTVELTENVRQEEAWERQALAELRNGSVTDALTAYRQQGRMVVDDTPATTLARAVDDWHRYITDTGNLRGALLIAHRNSTVDELNRQARARVAAAGILRGPAVEAGDREYRAGDRILCLRNHSKLGVLNGDLGVVTAADATTRTLTVRFDRRPDPVRLPAWYLDDGHIDHGYAITGHKAQGATVDCTYVVGSSATTREWSYVAMSRGRQANTLYLVSPPSDDECSHLTHDRSDQMHRLDAGLSRTERQTAVIDTGNELAPLATGVQVQPSAWQGARTPLQWTPPPASRWPQESAHGPVRWVPDSWLTRDAPRRAAPVATARAAQRQAPWRSLGR